MRDGAGVISLFARVIQQLGLRTQKIQANVHYSNTAMSGTAKRRASALRSALDLSIQACAD